MTNNEFTTLDNDLLLVNGDHDTLFYYNVVDNKVIFSQHCMKQFGVPEVIERPTEEHILEYLSPQNIDQLKIRISQRLRAQEKYFFIDFIAYSQSGDEVNFYLKAAANYDGNGKPTAIKGLLLDMNPTHFNLIHEERLSFIDQLTKLPNRKAFFQDMDNILKTQSAKGYIFLVDLDNFEELNTAFGFSTGDKIIRHVANKLQKLFKKENARVYQMLGAKYVIQISDITAQTASLIMENITSQIRSNPLTLNKHEVMLTVSSSAVAYYGSIDTTDKLLLNAEIAIKKVKRGGKNNFSFYHKGDGIFFVKQFEMISDMERAVKMGCSEFKLFYQPILSSKSLTCVGAEALIRWDSPKHSMIMPNTFIPFLEKTSLMVDVEKWIFKTAFEQCKLWIEKSNNPDFYLHINLSPTQITRETLYSEVTSAMYENSLSSQNVVLETTETALILDLDRGSNVLNQFRNHGIHVALDDFGTGYSSLNYLKNLPVDEVKIDKSFVKGIESDKSAKNFLARIVNIIQSTGYDTCVEGVETDPQKNYLKELQVDLLQGFLFSKPVPSNDFEKNFILRS